jgi:lipoate---protein ligase
MHKWRFIDSPLMPALENMAMDKVLLTSRSRGWAPDTLLFLGFSPPCALVGYHQSIELEIEEDYCREHGIHINRRITGGGGIYMDEGALGWALFGGKNTPGIPSDLDEMYERICQGVVVGLSRLGVNAKFRPKNDIEVDGRKISGSGGTESGGAFIYHGTVLCDFDVDTMIRCLKLPIKKLEDKQVQSFRQRVTSLREVLGHVPPMAVVKNALMEGFSDVLGMILETGGLTDQESRLLEEEIPRFRSEEWLQGGRTVVQSSELTISDYKAPGGMIRISVLLDRDRQRIKSAFITGDFFAYPERSILDLEAFLRNSSSAAADVLTNIHRFFEVNSIQIPGVNADHMAEAVCRAISGTAVQA